MTYLNTVGEANMYAWFVYVPQKFYIKFEDNDQDQLTLIRSAQTNKSTINGAIIKTKTPKESTQKNDVGKKPKKSNPRKQVLTFDLLEVKTEGS